MQSSIPILISETWPDYALLDSGNGLKLERFGSYTVARPDPRILWTKSAPDLWDHADAKYTRTSPTEGNWQITHPAPDPWTIQYKSLTFLLKPTSFKHIGLF